MRLLLFLLLLGVFLPSSAPAQTWQRADVYFLEWDTETRASLSAERLRQSAEAKFTLRAEALAGLVASLDLGRLRPVRPGGDGDTRLVVDLFAAGGAAPSTYHADFFHLASADNRLRRAIGPGFRERIRALVRQHARPNHGAAANARSSRR